MRCRKVVLWLYPSDLITIPLPSGDFLIKLGYTLTRHVPVMSFLLYIIVDLDATLILIIISFSFFMFCSGSSHRQDIKYRLLSLNFRYTVYWKVYKLRNYQLSLPSPCSILPLYLLVIASRVPTRLMRNREIPRKTKFGIKSTNPENASAKDRLAEEANMASLMLIISYLRRCKFILFFSIKSDCLRCCSWFHWAKQFFRELCRIKWVLVLHACIIDPILILHFKFAGGLGKQYEIGTKL